MSDTENTPALERHPWPPFIPEGARILIMGTFPPGQHRWAMNFYYPNRTNDFWKMMGLIFLGSANALYSPATKQYDLPTIKQLLTQRHIAMSDTARAVRRLRGNASDKYLEIVEPLDLTAILAKMPDCRALVTTGEKAASVIASLTATEIPPVGQMVTSPSGLHIWRMPSTSRAYPLALEKKAEIYSRLFTAENII